MTKKLSTILRGIYWKVLLFYLYQLIRFNNNETTLLLVSQRLGYPGYTSKLLSQITIVSRMKKSFREFLLYFLPSIMEFYVESLSNNNGLSLHSCWCIMHRKNVFTEVVVLLGTQPISLCRISCRLRKLEKPRWHIQSTLEVKKVLVALTDGSVYAFYNRQGSLTRDFLKAWMPIMKMKEHWVYNHMRYGEWNIICWLTCLWKKELGRKSHDTGRCV